jgi:glycosyltransferase involved in cell wall biosynthesis
VSRLAVVVSHPIQYYAPLWRALAREPGLDLRVFFATRVGLDKTYDVEMRTELAWATDLTAGYAYEFLPEAASFQRTGFHVDNPSLGAALSRFAPDAVVLHGYGSKTLLRALAFAKWHGARALLVADSSGDLAPPGWRRRLKRLVAPRLLRRYDAALTMGDRGEDHLAGLGFPRARMFRTPTMMDEAFWTARRERPRLRAQERAGLGLAESDFVVLAAAKLSPRKRIGDLIAAARGLRVTLLIAGEGEQRAALEAEAREAGVDARFLGFVNIDALPALYAAADAFAHPAEREPYGMVAVEAAIVGLPLLVSDDMGAVGPGAIARPGVNALVHRAGDAAALAGHLSRLREDEDLRARLAAGSLLLSQDHDGKMSVAAVLAAADLKKATRGDLLKG